MLRTYGIMLPIVKKLTTLSHATGNVGMCEMTFGYIIIENWEILYNCERKKAWIIT